MMSLKKFKNNKINLGKIRLADIKNAALNILEKYTQKVWDIDIHITTQLDKVKANVQGNISSQIAKADILISGELEFKKLLRAIAHELCHLIYPNLDEYQEQDLFNEKVKNLEKEIKQKLKKGVTI